MPMRAAGHDAVPMVTTSSFSGVVKHRGGYANSLTTVYECPTCGREVKSRSTEDGEATMKETRTGSYQ